MSDERVAEQNPYRPPAARIAVTQPFPVAVGSFVPLRSAAQTLRFWLWIHASVNVLGSAVTFLAYRDGVPFSQDELNGSDLAIGSVSVALGAIYLVNVVLFARLVYRANQNVRALGVREPRYTPAAMVWWFFVPIANLFKPFDAFKDVYRCSFPAQEQPELHPILGTWWTFWIAALIANYVNGQIPMASVLPTLIATGLAALLGVASAVSAASATSALAERQDRTASLTA
jgi:hypothetical protein